MVSITEDINNRYLRPKLQELLLQCTDKQQAFFARLWGSVETIPFAKIPIAISQCESTIKKNSKVLEAEAKEE